MIRVVSAKYNVSETCLLLWGVLTEPYDCHKIHHRNSTIQIAQNVSYQVEILTKMSSSWQTAFDPVQNHSECLELRILLYGALAHLSHSPSLQLVFSSY